MAENVTIARPYADAAFELACAEGELASWLDVLNHLADIVSDPTLHTFMTDPRLEASQLSRLVEEVAGDLTKEQRNFVDILVENERLQVLPEIRDLFNTLKNAREGVLEAHIASAFPLDDAMIASLKSDLETRFNSKLLIKVAVDPELIGGVSIAVGDEVIDASIRGKLASMASALKN